MINMGDKGQVLLITLLVLTVATTIALSLIGRATLDLSMSNQLEESTRAFSAAEAGIEQALQSGVGTSGPQTLSSGITYDVSVNAIGGSTGIFRFSHETPKDVTETIWLVNHTAQGDVDETRVFTSNTIVLCWSQDSNPAMIATILYKRAANDYRVARMALDYSARGDFASSGITTNGCGLSYYRKVVDFTTMGINPASDILIAMRLRPVYADATIAIDSGIATLPKQGNQIESSGLTGTGITRKVVVYQQYPSPLAIFDSVIYSQSSFGHQ